MGTYYAAARDRLANVQDLTVGALATRTVLLDDERKRVSHFHFKPGDETGWHKHEYDYFVVYLTDARLLHMPRGGDEATLEHKARDSRAIAAGVEHNVRCLSTHDVELLEIEYKGAV